MELKTNMIQTNREAEIRNFQAELKNVVGKTKNSLEGLIIRITAPKDKSSVLEEKLLNTSIQQKMMRKKSNKEIKDEKIHKIIKLMTISIWGISSTEISFYLFILFKYINI